MQSRVHAFLKLKDPAMPTPFRDLRLRKHADYGLVYGASRKHHGKWLSFFYRAAAQEHAPAMPARFGITVPRVLGPAVLRNRIKRRIRIAARSLLHLLPAGTDVVLHPRPEAAVIPFAALEAELQTVFSIVAQRIGTGAVNTPLPRRPKTAGKPGRKAR